MKTNRLGTGPAEPGGELAGALQQKGFQELAEYVLESAIFAILQEAVSEGVAISPFGSEVYVSRGSWIASFVFLTTVSIYTMGVFNMALSAYMYSILLFTIVLLVLLQQARP